jgi:hypothetical protein
MKVNAIQNGFTGRENIKKEDLERIDELSQKMLDAHGKKRKIQDVDDADDGRWPKRYKYQSLGNIEPPKLSNDNLLEIFSYFNNKISILRALSLVNNQFNLVARSLMYKYGIYVDKAGLWSMDEQILEFIKNFSTLKIFDSNKRHFDALEENTPQHYYLNQLTKLSNLSSLSFKASDTKTVILEVASKMTQLTKLNLGHINITKEDLKQLTDLKSLQSLKSHSEEFYVEQQMSGLESFAAQFKALKLQHCRFNLQVFSNIESLDLRQNLPNASAMLESLPKLTSLVSRNFFSDMSKLTSLKNLWLTGGSDNNVSISKFPPNLEYFRCTLEMINCDFPPSMKSVYIGLIEFEYAANVYDLNMKKWTTMMAAVAKLRCPVTLRYVDIDVIEHKPFAAAISNPNIAIVIEEDRYTNTILTRFTKFSRGPLPARLHLTFYKWKRASRKKKFGQLLQELAQKMLVFVEYEELGQVRRPYYDFTY